MSASSPRWANYEYGGGVRRRTSRTLLRRMRPYVMAHKGLVAGSLLGTVAATVASLAGPWPLAFLVDAVLRQKGGMPAILKPLLGGADTGYLVLFVVGATLGISLLENGSTVFSEYITTKLEQHLVLDFRGDIFKEAQRLPFAYHDQRRSGDWIGRIVLHSDAMGEIPLTLPTMGQSLLTLLGMLAISLRINVPLALITLSIAPFIYYSLVYYGKNIVPRIRATKGLELIAMNTIYEAMSMIRVVVAFCREHFEFLKFRRQGETAMDARVDLTVRQASFSMVVNLLTAVGTGAVMFFGAWDVIHHTLSVGELLVIMSYVSSIYKPLQDISSSINTIQEQLVSLDMAIEIVDHDPEVFDKPDALALESSSGHVRFEGVHFAYRGRRRTLEDINFDAPPGSRVAIVGPTGAGKTTLANLMIRFHDPSQGRILLDGHDLRDLTLESVRSQVAIVLQEPLLFRGTLADNIRYGKLDASEEEIVAAAEAANAHSFISQLPRGYEAKVGERGATLSGGERQRISIARAFIKQAPVLILDEPTSSIDSKTEKVILDALERLMEGRTTFVISHRLSTIRDADLVLVLNRGRLVQAGAPDELVEQKGMYRQLCQAQGMALAAPGGPGRSLERAGAEPSLDELIGSGGPLPVEKLRTVPRHRLIEWARRRLVEAGEGTRTALEMAAALDLKGVAGSLLVAAVRRPGLRGRCLDVMKRLKPNAGGIFSQLDLLTPEQRALAVRLAWDAYGDALVPVMPKLAAELDEAACKQIVELAGGSDHPRRRRVFIEVLERGLDPHLDRMAMHHLVGVEDGAGLRRLAQSPQARVRALASHYVAPDGRSESGGDGSQGEDAVSNGARGSGEASGRGPEPREDPIPHRERGGPR